MGNSTAYSCVVILAAVLWFCYSISGERSAGVMFGSGLIILLLLVPIVMRKKTR